MVALVEMKKNWMYKLELNILQRKCLKLDVKDEAMVWHFKFSQLNFGGLTELSKKEVLLKLPSVEFENKFCEKCVLKKHPRTGFSKTLEYKIE